jgi:hypothetical protein
VREGLVSVDNARVFYKVALFGSGEIDADETARLRLAG